MSHPQPDPGPCLLDAIRILAQAELLAKRYLFAVRKLQHAEAYLLEGFQAFNRVGYIGAHTGSARVHTGSEMFVDSFDHFSGTHAIDSKWDFPKPEPIQ